MNMVVKFSAKEELKALPILLRHSPGVMLRDQTYVISAEAVGTLRDAGVHFQELGNAADPPSLEGAGVRV